MRGLDHLPGPIVVCVPADAPTVYEDDHFSQCALCGAEIRLRPHWPGGCSLVCLLCFIVNADAVEIEVALVADDVPTC